MLLTKDEQKQFAQLVNALIDIPLVPEHLEQEIFEHAIAVLDIALQEVLPAVFNALIREAEQGIDKDQARAFADRLVATANKNVDLPYLNEEQEATLLRAVINPLVKAMTSGRTLEDLLPTLRATSTP